MIERALLEKVEVRASALFVLSCLQLLIELLYIGSVTGSNRLRWRCNLFSKAVRGLLGTGLIMVGLLRTFAVT